MRSPSNRTEIRCIVFSDIVNSTLQSVAARQGGYEQSHNADVHLHIDLWREAVQTFGAEFFKPLGDGMLATFADPMSALLAVNHALTLLSNDPIGKKFAIRVGLHVGAVTVESDGDVLGADANLAARVMDAARAGEILVSDAYASLVKPYLRDHRLHDLGERDLKGFDTPVRLHRLSRLDSVEGTAAWPLRSDLPVFLDRFVGRKRERAALRRFLTDQVHRGVTLVGTAGCGKTRLASEAARDAQSDYPDGVNFVSLEEATDADGVLVRIAGALTIALSPNLNIRHALQVTLKNRRALLVLDNFEQALPAAGEISNLLQTLPLLHILVTSRDPLLYRGEQVVKLTPLNVPDPSATYRSISGSDSVKLFVDRVAASNDRFRITAANASEIADLCRVVEGLPLALELVAAEARYRSLSRLREMRSELLDISTDTVGLPARQRSLRTAFDWSYRQLNERMRLLFAQLGLFETSFGEDHVYDVCTGDDIDAGLRRLCDKGLVCYEEHDGSRPYRLLVPLREYARECLGPPTGAVRQRFIAAFTRRAQNLLENWNANAESQALAGIRADLENFRAAWHLACEDDIPEVISDLGVTVTIFATALPREANIEGWVEKTHHALQQMGDTYRLGRLHNTQARLASRRGAFVDAVRFQQAALDHLIGKCSPYELADAHSTLAFFALRAQNYRMAEHHARLGMEYGSRHRADEPEAVALFVLANVLTPGDQAQATQMAERSMDLFRERGNARGMAHASVALAQIAEANGDIAAAETHYRNALNFCWGQGEEVQVVRCLEAIARFYARHGDRSFARLLFACAAESQRSLGMPETARLALPEHVENEADDSCPSLSAVVERVLSAPEGRS
jgi:predicted ATPase/class 3 adenylate cyclase